SPPLTPPPAGGGVREASTLSKGIFRTYSFKKFGTEQGLNYDFVNDIMQDREGILWIGTDIGVNQFRGERFQIYDESDGLINDIVWAILQDRKGNFWFGTNGGISRFTFPITPHTDRFASEPVVTNYTIKDGLRSNIIYSIFEDKKGALWFGTRNGGVCKLSPGSSKFEIFTTAIGLINNTVYSISEDKTGNLWFGTREGAFLFDPKTRVFKKPPGDNGVGRYKVYKIFKDSKDNLWFGILGGLLTMYDGKHYKKFGKDDGLKHKFILCITEDKENNLWFGAYGGGIYKYDGKKFTNYSSKDGMSSDSPFFLTCDNNNNIWIGLSQGVDRFDQKTQTFKHYGKQEGFFGVKTVQNAVCNDRQGNIWIGTIMGAVKYNPSKDIVNSFEPLTHINKIRIHLKDTKFPANAVFTYDQNHITFHFIGVSLTNPEKVLYQHRLEGFDKKDWWSPKSKENFITYSNLPGGKYTFMVKARNNDGVWNEQPTTYQFTVEKPWWLTWWFYTLCGLFVGSSFFSFVKIRTASLQKTKRVLENKVSERTKELSEANKSITDSINYASRIQDAILPDTTQLRKFFPDSFVYYKIKDVVSGDIPWLMQKGDDIYVTVVDCTGHGVPGAMLSMIGHFLLKETISSKNILQPSEILNRLHNSVNLTLNQNINTDSKDGMDIALCKINLKNMEIEYAGAHRPLLHISNGVVSEIKGDRFPIGGTQYARKGREILFTNHRIKIKKEDSIFFYSDGLTDQFGGPDDKKFSQRRVKDLLLDNQHLPMQEQKELLENTIEQWMNNQDQTDDILLIGIRF
ncbi:MAG: SpoIIE family protein phosphatase, partial [Bacteroidetes bacterium]|nr:SpoIIE family protein phosphatase [Bacteroidota bacterium]